MLMAFSFKLRLASPFEDIIRALSVKSSTMFTPASISLRFTSKVGTPSKTDKKYRDKISKLNAAIMGTDSDPYYGAPVIVLVLADGNANTFVEDGSCVLENLMLAAYAEGLGSVWVHREREIFDSEEGKALLREWGLSETLRGVGSIALGYPAADPREALPRKNDYIRYI
mgnify:CR=1 FL=1